MTGFWEAGHGQGVWLGDFFSQDLREFGGRLSIVG